MNAQGRLDHLFAWKTREHGLFDRGDEIPQLASDDTDGLLIAHEVDHRLVPRRGRSVLDILGCSHRIRKLVNQPYRASRDISKLGVALEL